MARVTLSCLNCMFDTLNSSDEMLVIVFYHVTVVCFACDPHLRLWQKGLQNAGLSPSRQSAGSPDRNPHEMDTMNTAGGQCTV